MSNTKAVSNEEIISALLMHGTVKAAATAAGTTPRTIYDRMRDSDFKELYTAARAEIMREAMSIAKKKLVQAMDTIGEIMNNIDNPPATRLQAAQHIINNFLKFSERLDIDENSQKEAEKSFWNL